MSETFDIFIIGGGINGVGIARDAAGRGLKVMLVEQDDLASSTSSASSKLIHGGLRYLEHYEFRLVRESLQERERLWKLAPHLIKPLRFLLPFHKGLRPAIVLRAGLFLYDHIGGRKLLPASKAISFNGPPYSGVLRGNFTKGFEYSDCWVDDARLVILNALGAQELGAEIHTRTKFVQARRSVDHWEIDYIDESGRVAQATARAIVNAAGPWVSDALSNCQTAKPVSSKTMLVKGSHIVVPKLYEHDRSYTFQNADGRIVFAIPYERNFTLIGTTDIPFSGDPSSAHADSDEVAYLCKTASNYFNRAITTNEIIWSYSGVRPLYDDGASNASAATRDYVLELDHAEGRLPLLSIFGGKITTYRRLAEDALAKLAPLINFQKSGWTSSAPLPGGDLPYTGNPMKAFELLTADLESRFFWLEKNTLNRVARSYGTRAFELLDGAQTNADLGLDFGAGLSEREIQYLVETEWAETSEDILWRRTKLGLHMNDQQRIAVQEYLSGKGAKLQA